jgi:hypothetical protein
MGNSKSFVLRFRDIETDDTVKNHQDIIKRNGYTLGGVGGRKRRKEITTNSLTRLS